MTHLESANQSLASLMRAKYPGAYDDLSDSDLESKVLAKYPQYKDLATSKSVEPERPSMGKAESIGPGQPQGMLSRATDALKQTVMGPPERQDAQAAGVGLQPTLYDMAKGGAKLGADTLAGTAIAMGTAQAAPYVGPAASFAFNKVLSARNTGVGVTLYELYKGKDPITAIWHGAEAAIGRKLLGEGKAASEATKIRQVSSEAERIAKQAPKILKEASVAESAIRTETNLVGRAVDVGGKRGTISSIMQRASDKAGGGMEPPRYKVLFEDGSERYVNARGTKLVEKISEKAPKIAKAAIQKLPPPKNESEMLLRLNQIYHTDKASRDAVLDAAKQTWPNNWQDMMLKIKRSQTRF